MSCRLLHARRDCTPPGSNLLFRFPGWACDPTTVLQGITPACSTFPSAEPEDRTEDVNLLNHDPLKILYPGGREANGHTEKAEYSISKAWWSLTGMCRLDPEQATSK